MVLPKSTVHLSRFAGTALKSFTHGYAQTVVAASQSSYASQNTQVAPLASNFLTRFGKSNKPQDQQAYHNTLAAGQTYAGNAPPRHDTPHHDSGLAQYYDAWHNQQKIDARDWHQHEFTKRIGWKPPSVIPRSDNQKVEVAEVESIVEESDARIARDGVKRSYSTSAVNDFAKAIDNEAAEAVAIAQVNEAIVEEAEKSKLDAEKVAIASSGPESVTSEATGETISTAATSVTDSDAYSSHLDVLYQAKQYAQIPAAFEAMLRAGIAKPSQSSYRALLSSAIELTPNKHQQVPRVLEVYSDMLRRKIIPDADTYTAILTVLAVRALDAVVTEKHLEQKRQRYSQPNETDRFAFRSDRLEHAILTEDQSLSIGLRILIGAPTTITFSATLYESLIKACALRGQLADMVRLYGAMEANKLQPHASVFPAMIEAFAVAGDLRNAVECYDEYKDLAVANIDGLNDMVRMDNEVYAAMIKAYGFCERLSGAERFLSQIQVAQPDETKRQQLLESISLNALIPIQVEARQFDKTLDLVNSLSTNAYADALELIAVKAADQNDMVEGNKAFDALVSIGANLAAAAGAMIAMHVRNHNVQAAEAYWRSLETSTPIIDSIEPTVMRTVALISTGQTMRGLRSARSMLGRIRDHDRKTASASRLVVDRIEEAVEIVGQTTLKAAQPLAIEPSIELMYMMTENGTLITSFAEDILNGLTAEQISQLAPAELDLFVSVQSRLILGEAGRDVAGPARFAFLLDTIVSRSVLPDVNTENLIEKTLINLDRNDLSRLWNSYRYPAATGFVPSAYPPASPFPNFAPVSVQPSYDDSFDPYVALTDNKGSVTITDLLEKSHGRPLAVLNEAMTKLRNIRRAGRHPRFFAYSKLINAAAKAEQFETCNEILEMAKQDVPFMAQYRVVRYGWISILDSMLAACLMVGRREAAASYHQDLLDMGAAPSANTYGLYITTLKENAQTFDEASEAVKLFLRSKAEGVEPTSFLYNALIGKLGKARRIDDCLFYFAEMRTVGVRPTSVTYGTVVNALCRVSDEKFAEEIFEEMESCANYKPRPAPYHSLMQYFLTTKRDRSKVLTYYERMLSRSIAPTVHTYKLLIDAHAALEPVNMAAAEAVLVDMKKAGVQPEAVHYASLIHAKGCVAYDMSGARAIFDSIVSEGKTRLQACVYQAVFESLVANRRMGDADALLRHMRDNRVELTPYIANALIHGWALERDIEKAKDAFARVSLAHREPSTYETMVRAHMAVEDKEGARVVVREALSRGYPAAVAGKITELVGGGRL